MLLRCVHSITVAASSVTISIALAILVAVTTVAANISQAKHQTTAAAYGIEGMLQVQ